MGIDLTFSPEDSLVIVGVLSTVGLPDIVAILKRAEYSELVKFLIAAGTSIVLAILTAYAGGKLTGVFTVVQLAALIFAGAHAQYVLYFKKYVNPFLEDSGLEPKPE